MAVVIDAPEVKPSAPSPVEFLPAVHPTSGMPRNYRVEMNRFGGFRRGDVIPKHIVVRSAGAGAAGREDEICRQKVLKRQLSETYDEVNCDIATSEPLVPFSLSSAAPVSDVKDLELKVGGLRAEVAAVEKDRDGWKSIAGSKDSLLAEQQGLIGELRATLAAREEVIAKQQGEIRVLTDAMDQATQPKGKK